jgi:hypothetical protein
VDVTLLYRRKLSAWGLLDIKVVKSCLASSFDTASSQSFLRITNILLVNRPLSTRHIPYLYAAYNWRRLRSCRESRAKVRNRGKGVTVSTLQATNNEQISRRVNKHAITLSSAIHLQTSVYDLNTYSDTARLFRFSGARKMYTVLLRPSHLLTRTTTQ